MKSSATYFLTFLFTMTSFSFKGNDNKMVILTNLRCEMLMDPLGIDIKAPSLSWEISGKERGIEQTAYQVIVASSINKLNKNEGDLWNSGKVESNESIQIGYSGVLLKSRAECYWKVKVWTNKGESNWSKPAHWTMGLLDWEDWKAKWIGLDRAFPWDSVSKMAR
ncbi:MAG TPA: hypothetical protein VNS32_03875, partial [Flavisolibacter sp.]|nr:hypothetical protein [Flavisolibacter sp.]